MSDISEPKTIFSSFIFNKILLFNLFLPRPPLLHNAGPLAYQELTLYPVVPVTCKKTGKVLSFKLKSQ